jgi:hypothetical protein
MSKISLKHSGGNVVSLNSPTNAPSAADVAFKLPNADGSDGQAIVTDGSGNLSFGSVAATRNLIINGAMQVAQRGTSSTDSGYGSVDRFRSLYSGTDEAPTHAQADVAAGTTPYTLGFRKSYKFTNGNQTSGAGAGDQVALMQKIEAQDIANSGWNYLSASSYITLSFWVKSSVAQNFYGNLVTNDGTDYNYPFETGSLTADTWTKITKTISGNSNLTFNNDNGIGLSFQIAMFRGTDKTGTVSLNAWGAFSSSAQTPDMTSTWYTTNDATFEITGVQLEVGSVATDFEHRSFGQELALCQRYFFNIKGDNNNKSSVLGYANSSSNFRAVVNFPTPMRANPTFTGSSTSMVIDLYDDSATFNVNTISINSSTTNSNPHQICVEANTSSMTAGQGGQFEFRADNGFMNFSAEL